jgi:hypothetical protein
VSISRDNNIISVTDVFTFRISPLVPTKKDLKVVKITTWDWALIIRFLQGTRIQISSNGHGTPLIIGSQNYWSYIKWSDNLKDLINDIDPSMTLTDMILSLQIPNINGDEVRPNNINCVINDNNSSASIIDNKMNLSFNFVSDHATLICMDNLTPDVEMTNIKISFFVFDLERTSEGGLAYNDADVDFSASINIQYLPDWLIDLFSSWKTEFKSNVENSLRDLLLTDDVKKALGAAILGIVKWNAWGLKNISSVTIINNELVVRYLE